MNRDEPVTGQSPNETPVRIADAGERRYELLREIGRGGMATVYLAEREVAGYRHRVALKILNGRFAADEDALARFATERQILAHLEHPSIARIFDGGQTQNGEPYLAMELVEGLPIDRHCQNEGLPVEERLRLFRDVCRAVHFAHQNLVVHRDLKPSNILVTADGVPKLLDFGIAKLLDPDGSLVETIDGSHPLTLRYASPEQIRGEPLTTASDVYSLGVVLYELLVGHPPHDQGSIPDLVAAICDRPPTTPSTAVRTGPPPEGEIDVVQVDRLAHRLQGDLDHIVLAALRKEPGRRYASAEQLAEDVDRHLAGLPILARPSTFSYRAKKFLARHTMPVFAAATGVLLVLVFAIVTAFQARTIAAERDRAERERDRAEEVSDFLVDLFEVSDPTGESGAADWTAREILEAGAERLETELSDRPALQAPLLATLGRVFHRLGESARGRSMLEEALRRGREAFGDASNWDLPHQGQLGWMLFRDGAYDEAEPIFTRTIERARSAGDDEALLLAWTGLASLRYGQERYGEAEELFRSVLDLQIRRFGEDDRSVARTRSNLGLLLSELGQTKEAEELYRRALESNRRRLGDDHPEVLSISENLGILLISTGRNEEAAEIFRRVLDRRLEIYDSNHPDIVRALNNVGWALFQDRKLGDTEEIYRQALAALASREVRNPSIEASILVNLGWVLEEQTRFAEASEIYRRSLEENLRIAPRRSFAVASSLESLGSTLVADGLIEEGEPLLKEALEIQDVLAEEIPVDRTSTLLGLAEARLLRGDPDTCLARAREALEELLAGLPEDDWRVAEGRVTTGRCLAALGQSEEAREMLEHGLVSYARYGEDDPRAIVVRDLLKELSLSSEND